MSETRFCPMIKDHCKNELCIAWARSECSYFSYYARGRQQIKATGDWKTNASNNGEPWSKEEDTVLVKDFEAGKGIPDLSQLHKRSPHAIEMRLERLGKIEPVQEPPQKAAAK
jgi:hypothetical protein